ncbi:Hypothetical protein AJAP_34965 [Amycolatopsis japonica]|uniref:Uncharacterized protein n=1 Tax=Amycolatopsis japonica TaxID=208439 RepID=A0A075VAA5_9PSEU|nr:Hypothetical protein AJAP_34965 [Amycolatopsis japonica]
MPPPVCGAPAGLTFTCGVLPGVPHGFVNAAGTTRAELDDGALLLDGGSLLDGGLLLDGGWLLDGGLVGVVVGGGQTISNSTVAVPLAAGRFGPPSHRKLALNLPVLPAAFPCPVYVAPDWAESVTGPVRPGDVTALRVPWQLAVKSSACPGATFAGLTDNFGGGAVADA